MNVTEGVNVAVDVSDGVGDKLWVMVGVSGEVIVILCVVVTDLLIVPVWVMFLDRVGEVVRDIVNVGVGAGGGVRVADIDRVWVMDRDFEVVGPGVMVKD